MNILAIDPGGNMGWAMMRDSVLFWGTVKLTEPGTEHPGARFKRAMDWFDGSFAQFGAGAPELVIYEDPISKSYSPARFNFGYVAILEAKSARHSVKTTSVKVRQLKYFATGTGVAKKTMMIPAAIDRLKRLGLEYTELTEHEADALWLLWYGLEHYAA